MNRGIPVTFPIGFPAIMRGSQILEYVYGEEVSDYSKSKYREKIRLKPGFDPDWLEELKVRFLARATAYIMTVCSLDGILERSYNHFLKYLRKIDYTSLSPDDEEVKSLCKLHKEEIKDYKYYRSKVFAHTAFAAPRKDSKSLQHTSLKYYAGNVLYLKADFLALGGGSVIIDKEESYPEISIVGGHQKIREHYSRWESMFMNILDNVDISELRGRLEGVTLL